MDVVTPVTPLQLRDIGTYKGKEHDKEEIYKMLTDVWKPDKLYKFPRKEEYGKKRSFKYEWLQIYPWLSYSAVMDGAFCLPCVLFASAVKKGGLKLDRLLYNPICTWTSATRKFKEHECNSEVHKASVVMAEEFKKSVENKSVPIHHMLDQAAARSIEENRAKVKSILKTVILCGKQNLPLRGHHDDSSHLDGDNNPGNFQKLLEFRVDAGDKILEDHLKNAAKNATYRSKTIQNEIISCCGEYITNKIVEDIKKKMIILLSWQMK